MTNGFENNLYTFWAGLIWGVLAFLYTIAFVLYIPTLGHSWRIPVHLRALFMNKNWIYSRRVLNRGLWK